MAANTQGGRRQVDLGGVEAAFNEYKVSLSQTVAKAMLSMQRLGDKVFRLTEEAMKSDTIGPVDEKLVDLAKKIIDTTGQLLQRNPSLGAKNARQLGNEHLIAGTNTVDEPLTTPGGYHKMPTPPGVDMGGEDDA